MLFQLQTSIQGFILLSKKLKRTNSSEVHFPVVAGAGTHGGVASSATACRNAPASAFDPQNGSRRAMAGPCFPPPSPSLRGGCDKLYPGKTNCQHSPPHPFFPTIPVATIPLPQSPRCCSISCVAGSPLLYCPSPFFHFTSLSKVDLALKLPHLQSPCGRTSSFKNK